jgi:hypothetical protein
MRGLTLGLIALAVVMAVLRLGTGIVYESGAPIAALVIKTRPGPLVERAESPAYPLAADIVLDREEPQLAYAPLYLALMRAAWGVVAVSLVAVAWTARRRPA